MDDNKFDESRTEVQSYSKDTYTDSSVQLALVESLSIRLRIVQLLHEPHFELCYDQVLSLGSERTDALQTCSHLVKDKNGSTPFQWKLLDCLIRRLVLDSFALLVQPPWRTPTRYFTHSLKLSFDAALSMISPEPLLPLFLHLQISLHLDRSPLGLKLKLVVLPHDGKT